MIPKREVIHVKLLGERREQLGTWEIPKFEREPPFILNACRVFQRESTGVYVQQPHYMIPFHVNPVN